MDRGYVALGLVQGALAALNAVGIVLLWRTTRVVNLAQPAAGLVGGVLTGMLVSSDGWSFWWATPVGIGVGALLAYMAERLVMVRLQHAPRVVPMIATLGLAQLFSSLQAGIPFILGGRLPAYDIDIGVDWFLFPVLLKGPHLLALGVLPIAVWSLWYFVHRTRTGVAATAVGQDVERAMTLGVDAGFVRSITWAVAGALSGLAGVLAVPVLGFSLGDGVAPTVLLLALAPAVLAGMRSIPLTTVLALGVGVAYQFALVQAPTAGVADVVLAGMVLAGVAVRRRRLGRESAATATTPWNAAANLPPLPRAVRTARRWRTAVWAAIPATVVAAAVPPLWLSPSADVRYGTAGALTLGAISIAVAWMFAGEVAFGNWGIAGFAAAAAFAAPGPLPVRALAGITVGALLGAGLGCLDRDRGSLVVSVAGLAVALAAPVVVDRYTNPTFGLHGQHGAIVAGTVTATTAIAVSALRTTRFGTRLVACRDEPRRSREFGLAPRRSRVLALALSGAIAGLAGASYLAAVPTGAAPGAFGAGRSLELLAFAVVGGLGSGLAASIGAAGLLWSRVVLPPPWSVIASGAGVLWVVLFAPGGVGAALARARNVVAGWVTGLDPVDVGIAATVTVPDADGGDRFERETEAVVQGADSRESLATPTVRAAMAAAWALGSVGIATLVSLPRMLDDHATIDMAGLGPWYVATVATLAAVAGAHAARARSTVPVTTPTALVVVLGIAVAAFSVSNDAELLALAATPGVVVGGRALGHLVAMVRVAVRWRSRAAAMGLVGASVMFGAVGAVHLLAVAGGNGLVAAARVALWYLAGSLLAAFAAAFRLTADVARIARVPDASPSGQRRHWTPLRVDAVTLAYADGPLILDGVDLEATGGQVVGLIGANGCGKSTLLRAIAGLVPVSAGRIDAAGQEITALRADERAADGIALVNGSRPVFNDLTVYENLRVGAYLTHRSRRSFHAALTAITPVLGSLADRLDTRAGVLSGGEQRRLAIAQTMFLSPTVILADEITLGLDVHAQQATVELLRSLAADGIAVIVVEHDLDLVEAIADRVVRMDHGRIVDVAAADRLTDIAPAARFLTGART